MSKSGFVLTCKLEDGTEVAAEFADINDRDGCDISLGMYRANLGPITSEVWEKMVGKFNGTFLHE
ncbi:hypothetical protein [Effusibacillus consociatus]|uniref:Peptidylprolyl isomerase n=1 Tax=Effusibacillus consociatus TaxID=1117041 RepID=A0ABV9PYK1_9BACL